MKSTIFTLLILLACNAYSQKVTNFRLQDSQNATKSYSDLKGEKLTVIDFWATWCNPCVKAIPELNTIYDNFKDKGVAFISINCDGPRSVSKAVPMSKSLKIVYPVLLDINSDVKNQLNLSAFPTLIILNAEGKIMYIHEGYEPGYTDDIVQALEKQLKAI